MQKAFRIFTTLALSQFSLKIQTDSFADIYKMATQSTKVEFNRLNHVSTTVKTDPTQQKWTPNG